MNRNSFFMHACLASALILSGLAQAADRTIIVLDGSGSMWGQIEGRPKLQIARETLDTVLRDMPADMELGLMAYGHNRKGDCDDIEMLVAPRAGAAPAIIEAAERMKFLGMTPLSAAVTRAAETLRHTEQKATVVLITDGLETCKLDPCSVGKSLEASGVDFTAHVVGFGLSAEEGKQVACLAENTGGSYFAAADAESLAQALSQAVVATPEPPEAPEAPPEAALQAPDSAPMSSRISVDWTGPGAGRDEVRVSDPDARHGEGQVLHRTRIRPDDGNTVAVVAPALPGDYELQYFSSEQRRVLATRTIRIEAVEVTLSAPDSVPPASSITVAWTGPGAERDQVRMFDPAARGGEGQVLQRQRIRRDHGEDNTVTLDAPELPGDYQLQYYNTVNRKVLATRPLTVE